MRVKITQNIDARPRAIPSQKVTQYQGKESARNSNTRTAHVYHSSFRTSHPHSQAMCKIWRQLLLWSLATATVFPKILDLSSPICIENWWFLVKTKCLWSYLVCKVLCLRSWVVGFCSEQSKNCIDSNMFFHLFHKLGRNCLDRFFHKLSKKNNNWLVSRYKIKLRQSRGGGNLLSFG